MGSGLFIFKNCKVFVQDAVLFFKSIESLGFHHNLNIRGMQCGLPGSNRDVGLSHHAQACTTECRNDGFVMHAAVVEMVVAK